MKDVTADQDVLMNQAPGTIMDYYCDIESRFVKRYGEEWVKKNADVIARLVCASAKDFDTACISACLQEIRDAMNGKLENIAESIYELLHYLEHSDCIDIMPENNELV